MRVLTAIDGVLLNRVFQPIANSLARFCSCYQLAVLCFVIHAVLAIKYCWWPFAATLVCCSFFLTLYALAFDRLSGQFSMAEPFTLARITAVWLYACFTVPHVFLTADHLSDAGPTVFLVGLYFISCRKIKPPPRRKKEHIPANASLAPT